LSVKAIADLVADDNVEDATPQDMAIKINLQDAFGNDDRIGGNKSRFDSFPYLIETDSGQVYEGSVQDGIINLQQFDVRQGFKLVVNGIEYVKQGQGGGEG
jgi:hypothetical protein